MVGSTSPVTRVISQETAEYGAGGSTWCRCTFLVVAGTLAGVLCCCFVALAIPGHRLIPGHLAVQLNSQTNHTKEEEKFTFLAEQQRLENC